MPANSPSEPAPGQPLLRRLDQLAVAGLIVFSLVVLAWYWIAQGGLSHRFIEIDRVDPTTITYQVDLNTADWTEETTGTCGDIVARDSAGRPIFRGI